MVDEKENKLTEEDVSKLAKALERIDMAELWRDYSVSVRKHLDRNRETRRKTWENAMRNPTVLCLDYQLV